MRCGLSGGLKCTVCTRHGVLPVHTASGMADGAVRVVSVCGPQSCPGLGVPLCMCLPVGGAGEAGCDWAHVGEQVLGAWACTGVHRYEAGEQNCVPEQLSVSLASGGTRTPVALVAEGAVWVLAEKGPSRGSLTPRRMVSLRRIWKDLASLGLLPNIDEALTEHWLLTASVGRWE